VNAYTSIVVNDRIDTLVREAAEHRLLASDGPNAVSRVFASIASAWASATAQADASRPVLPRLDDYPYRS
jgi:hypothetical protein